MDFYTTGVNKLISVGKNLWIVMVPILINKDVFEPSDNLKFTVQNRSYFYTNNKTKWHIKESRLRFQFNSRLKYVS